MAVGRLGAEFGISGVDGGGGREGSIIYDIKRFYEF